MDKVVNAKYQLAGLIAFHKNKLLLLFILISNTFAIPSCTNHQENKQMVAADVEVFPNPVSNTVFVRYKICKNGSFTILSKSGQSVLKAALPKGNLTTAISVQNLQSDLYFYIISLSENDSAFGKLLIMK